MLKRKITLLPFDSIELDAEPEYVIDGLIPAEGLTVIWGPPKSHKSFWAYDMAMHIALGWKYRGRDVRQGQVVYCAFEGGRGFKKRCIAYKQHFLKDHAEVVLFHLQPLRLDLIKEAKLLIDAIEDQLDGTIPILITLDTLNRSLVGSESKDEHMSAYVAAADMLRERFNCAVVIVHHCGIETGRPRGHTSLTGSADAQHAVKRSEKASTLTVEFMKDGDEGDVLGSRFEVIEIGTDDKGKAITSGVLVPIDGPLPKQSTTRLTTRQRLGLDALISMAGQRNESLPVSFGLPTSLRCIPVEAWKDEVLTRGVIDKDGSNPRRAFADLSTQLKGKGLAAERDGLIWPIL